MYGAKLKKIKTKKLSKLNHDCVKTIFNVMMCVSKVLKHKKM